MKPIIVRKKDSEGRWYRVGNANPHAERVGGQYDYLHWSRGVQWLSFSLLRMESGDPSLLQQVSHAQWRRGCLERGSSVPHRDGRLFIECGKGSCTRILLLPWYGWVTRRNSKHLFCWELEQLAIKENSLLLSADSKLGIAIKDKLNLCISNTAVQELVRCIRSQMDSLLVGLPKKEMIAMALDPWT